MFLIDQLIKRGKASFRRLCL